MIVKDADETAVGHDGSAAGQGRLPRDGHGGWREVLCVFLRLGCTAFGGPVAHLGYFRSEFVERRRWLDDARFSSLVALCQFLPGPTSSQVGFAIGLSQAGWPGALAAWAGFTLPSVLLLLAFATALLEVPALAGSALVHGLKLAAVAIVAHAVVSMARSLCPSWKHWLIALAAAALALGAAGTAGQLLALLAGACAGLLLSSMPSDEGPSPAGSAVPGGPAASSVSPAAARSALALLVAGFVVLPIWAAAQSASAIAALTDGVFRAGALVFGGGHVVLPLLEAVVVPPGLVAADHFMAGYGATQAVPGPLFTFAAYLGAVAAWPLAGIGGALLLTVVIFLPGLLLLVAIMPLWARVRHWHALRGPLAGIGAAVVGVLLAALYDPVASSAWRQPVDVLISLTGFGLLLLRRRPGAGSIVTLSVIAALLADRLLR